jgi:hypothetical protein
MGRVVRGIGAMGSGVSPAMIDDRSGTIGGSDAALDARECVGSASAGCRRPSDA